MDLNFEFLDSEQPGPRDAPIQCYIRRERPTGTYRLYLGLSPGKILICFYFFISFSFSSLGFTNGFETNWSQTQVLVAFFLIKFFPFSLLESTCIV